MAYSVTVRAGSSPNISFKGDAQEAVSVTMRTQDGITAINSPIDNIVVYYSGVVEGVPGAGFPFTFPFSLS